MSKRRKRPFEKPFTKGLENFRPPADLTVSQWAAENRVLSRESSAEAGPWRNERTPYLVDVMDAFTDPKVNQITLVSSSQLGKSEAELNMIGYIIDQDPGSLLYIQPNLDDAKKFSRIRIAPMIRDSKTLRGKVADVKKRDSGNTILQKQFPGGMLTMIGSNSPAALASTPVRYVIGDELDRWALSAGSEGDPWRLAAARTTTFFNSKRVAVSTPTIKNASKIAELFSEGTQERWCVQCPDCGEFHNITFDNIKFDFETIMKGRKKDYKITSVNWACPGCGTLIPEDVVKKQPAKWVAEYPDAYERGHRSFWLNSFVSPWQPWEKTCREFLLARNDPEQLKVVFNTMLGELWEDRGDLIDEDTMLSRREDYGTRDDGSPIELPDGSLCLTCAVDVQDDRLEGEIRSWGHYHETWGIYRFFIPGDPNDESVWLELDKWIDRTYRFKDGTGLKISLTLVDSGGHKTQSVYKQTRARLGKRVFAIKGKGGDDIPFTKPPSKVDIVVNGQKLAKTWLYTIGVDAGKTSILKGMINVLEPGAKFCHFPKEMERGYDVAYFAGLLSEQLVMKSERGRTRWVWEKIPGHERNEPLDLFNYNLAAIYILSPDFDSLESRLKARKGGEKISATNTSKTQPKTRKKRNKAADMFASW